MKILDLDLDLTFESTRDFCLPISTNVNQREYTTDWEVSNFQGTVSDIFY